ncbi:hypothetical protein CYMTET_3747 [Cymbomonas tetramitiformis]|uniref:Uncharacterized protein n=1 Tax=Cymbomonas tetramitiformis TaxID=36881 RepID=A0AAE0H2S1_9CHLO|nr:hypothetical protein CYMTET_3747 [Cymbomonas tetramitiformis]
MRLSVDNKEEGGGQDGPTGTASVAQRTRTRGYQGARSQSGRPSGRGAGGNGRAEPDWAGNLDARGNGRGWLGSGSASGQVQAPGGGGVRHPADMLR